MTEIQNLVQLVDEQDNPVGTMEKMEAHRHPTLHRAVSVLVFNSSGDWLLHRRAAGKYHSACLWTNACCTHPWPGEAHADAARRRLQEEMGIAAEGELEHLFDFIYRAKVDKELTEYEYDRVFSLTSDEVPRPHPDEVDEWRYVTSEALHEELRLYSGRFTEWFKLIFQRSAGT
ncbi:MULTISPECIES: isopentenyl-diphosphate Delta-isomerase [unclassified Proteiniphilum]|jgi:isopentenyl-diphosphate delta-isomerase|uniref:isopentenyl-diphosphate Delta-isomerase n=1 Tax=unclassified Proteiniphilum TaxID=2622718 RepID=UPI00257DDE31|nr:MULTISPECIES: isopentenyl-diphosphate Delta-isomerase [unclassified Proteiniphilum]MDD4632334.1 isopentenyl-diphosphate Delta-isomerase [Proteiniphilum sp.]